MEWTKPQFVEISLSGEVTAYANTDSTIQPQPDSSERRQKSSTRSSSDRPNPE